VHGTPTHANFALFVEAFLMMTHICLKDQQMDEASRYVEKALALNRSSGKAWEMKGVIAEKKKEYIPAAEALKKAWDLSGHSDLGVGFRLAVNYMKGQDPVEAIKVSRAILEAHPNYPKLKETVFLPCCAALRP
jgi:tetratricopeptide repeat protein 21B